MTKKKKNTGKILLLIGLLFALASIFMIFLPGLEKKTDHSTTTISLAGLIFGNGTIETIIGSVSNKSKLDGGLSIMGLISFICIVLAIIIIIIKIFMKKDNIELLAGLLLIIGGIFMFMIKMAGTDIAINIAQSLSKSVSFKEYFKDFSLVSGPILYAIFSLLGGVVIIASKFVK